MGLNLKESAVIAAMDEFVRDFHSGDIILSPKALNLRITMPDKTEKNILGIKKERSNTCADLVAWAVSTYLLYKDLEVNPRSRLDHAYECLDYIERARSYSVIIPKKLTAALKESQEENKRLRELNDKLSRDNVNQKKLIEEMHKTIDKFGAKRLPSSDEGFNDDS
jgi:hypothetical protein